MVSDNELKVMFARAAELATSVPEHMQSAAFAFVLETIVGKDRGKEGDRVLTNASPAKKQVATQTAAGGGREAAEIATAEAAILQRLLQSSSDAAEWNAIWESGKALDRWLAVLAIADEEVGSGTSLTAPEIAKVLEKRFRVGGVHATNVNRDLRNARRMVGRRARGSGYEYWLTREGVTYISKRREEVASGGKVKKR